MSDKKKGGDWGAFGRVVKSHKLSKQEQDIYDHLVGKKPPPAGYNAALDNSGPMNPEAEAKRRGMKKAIIKMQNLRQREQNNK